MQSVSFCKRSKQVKADLVKIQLFPGHGIVKSTAGSQMEVMNQTENIYSQPLKQGTTGMTIPSPFDDTLQFTREHSGVHYLVWESGSSPRRTVVASQHQTDHMA